jgi:hypothetical protein
MNSDNRSDEQGVIAARPRGANGIPEPTDFDDPNLGIDFAPARKWPAAVPLGTDRLAWDRSHYAEWIAASAVIGGAVAAVVGCARELTGKSRRRTWNTRDGQMEGTKPHGDKLLPHGQRHW